MSYFPISPAKTASAIACASDGRIWVIADSSLVIIDAFSGETKYLSFHGDSELDDVAGGPDGAAWVTKKGGRIGRITADGDQSELTPPWNSSPNCITTGPDGNIWFTDNGLYGLGVYLLSPKIGKEKPPKPTSWVSVHLAADDRFGDIVAGSDGRMWFTTGNGVGVWTGLSETPEKVVFSVPFVPWQLAVGPDQAIWVTAPLQRRIARISSDAADRVHLLKAGFSPFGIAAGPDGNLWITASHGIARMKPDVSDPQITPFEF